MQYNTQWFSFIICAKGSVIGTFKDTLEGLKAIYRLQNNDYHYFDNQRRWQCNGNVCYAKSHLECFV